MRTPVIAVFDIGKTNKKVILFDEKYRIVEEKSRQFDEIKDENGEPCEDIDAVTRWVKDTLASLQTNPDIEIKAVNASAYGASFVHLDTHFKILTPLYNYLNPYPESLKRKFYDTYAGEVNLSLQTASPVLGSLNSGLQLYRLKYEKPELFDTIHYSLHLPQYISHIITSMTYSDITSIGSHTHLWDFKKNTYHDWVAQEGIIRKLPRLLKCDSVVFIDSVQNDNGIPVGGGVHDSSAALIPYLMTFQEPFVLLSTGTWCISLNPFNRSPLNAEELKKDCLCYLSYLGKPVKASRLFAGNEHEFQTRRIASHFNKSNDYYKSLEYDHRLVSELLKVMEGGDHSIAKPFTTGVESSSFENRNLLSYPSYEAAYHQLMIDIITQQAASTSLVLKGVDVKRIFVDGGFSRNSIFMNLLAAVFPGMEVFGAMVAQSTALGAALAIHTKWNRLPIPRDIINLNFYAKPAGDFDLLPARLKSSVGLNGN